MNTVEAARMLLRRRPLLLSKSEQYQTSPGPGRGFFMCGTALADCNRPALQWPCYCAASRPRPEAVVHSQTCERHIVGQNRVLLPI